MQPWGKLAVAEPLPLFRKAFAVSRPVARAVVHVCGLGHYELFLDGTKVGDHFLDPAWTVYAKTVVYNTFELTERLDPGRMCSA